MRAVLTEWTKLRTDPRTVWCLLALAATTVVTSVVAISTTRPSDCRPRPCTVDITVTSLSGVYVVQLAVVVLATLAISSEYAPKMIYATFMANPRRAEVYAAKAAVVASTVLVAGATTMVITLVAARVAVGGRGFASADLRHEALSMASGLDRRAYLGTLLYLGLVALLATGVATALRHSAAALTTTLMLLYTAPVAAQFVTDPTWQHRIHRYAPMTAGLAIQHTTNLAEQPIGPWQGLGVLAAYAVAALLAGAMIIRARDA
jgi:ABC-2 type transport system permease protein